MTSDLAGNVVPMKLTPLAFECPKCGAKPGDHCAKRCTTDELGRIHVQRTRLLIPFHEEPGPLDSPCWVCELAVNNKGYARIRRYGREWLAHRWMWKELRGPIPEGLVIDHLCRVTRCINPEHLEPVDFDENVHRGRGTIVTREQAIEIRRLRHLGLTYQQCGDQVGVSGANARSVIRGRSWRNLDVS
jgi:hypothetical protein